ncbi:MAG: hypothetical protein RJA34_2667 [Pseudomonadota bacterium]
MPADRCWQTCVGKIPTLWLSRQRLNTYTPTTQAPTPTPFHSARLIRVLSDLMVLECAAPSAAFAEKLGLWVDFTAAINLCAVHNASPPASDADVQPSQASGTQRSMGEEFAQSRAALESSIRQSFLVAAGRARIPLPPPHLDIPLDLALAYVPYRRFHLAQQRDMDLGVGPIRARIRGRLGADVPRLRQLAALDAAFDAILGERESKLLAFIPMLMEQRFGQLFLAHQQQLAHTQQADHPSLWMKPGGWLTRYRQELQTVLLAELDLRLQPTLGLIEALQDQKTQQL